MANTVDKWIPAEILWPVKTQDTEILRPVKTLAAEILQPTKYLKETNTLQPPEKMNKFWDDLKINLTYDSFNSTQDIYKTAGLKYRLLKFHRSEYSSP